MITKEELQAIIDQYEATNVLRLIGIKEYPAQMQPLLDFVKKLSTVKGEKINTAEQKRLEQIIKSDFIVQATDIKSEPYNKQETNRIFRLIRQKLYELKWQYYQQLLNDYCHFAFKLWQQSYYMNRTRILLGVIQETKPLTFLTQQRRVRAEHCLAASYLAISLYGMTYGSVGFIFASKLSQTVGETLDNYTQHKFKSQIIWTLGLCVQVGIGVTTGASGMLICSYVGATFMQAAAHRLVMFANQKPAVKQLSKQHPSTAQFISNTVEDIAFSLGAFLSVGLRNYFVTPKIQNAPANSAISEVKPVSSVQPVVLTSSTESFKKPVDAASSVSECEIPTGSYTSTCKITTHAFVPEDLNLKETWCEFEITCNKDDLNKHPPTYTNRFYAPSTMRDCLRGDNIENCDGYARIRNSDERRCVSEETRKLEAYPEKSPLIDTTCELPQGSYLASCPIRTSDRYYSTDKRLGQLSLCRFTFGCNDLSGRQKTTQVVTHSFFKDCITNLENCDSNLYVRSSRNERYCVDKTSATNPVGTPLRSLRK